MSSPNYSRLQISPANSLVSAGEFKFFCETFAFNLHNHFAKLGTSQSRLISIDSVK